MNDIVTDEAYENQASKLKFHELEREIVNLRSIISTVIIPKVASLEPEEVFSNIKFNFLRSRTG